MASSLAQTSARLLASVAVTALLLATPAWAQKKVLVQHTNRVSQPAQTEELPATRPQTGCTLEELQSLAMDFNPSIARAQALVQAARGNWVQVGLSPNPEVGYSGQQLGSGGRAEQHGVVLNQEIIRGQKLHLNRHVAEQEVVRAQHELAAAEQRVQTDVRIAFYQCLAAQRQIEATEELVEIAHKGLRASEALLEAKEASRGDVLQSRVELESASMLLQNASNRQESAWRQLATVVGQRELRRGALSGDLESDGAAISWDKAIERLTTSSPEIAVAMANIERARWQYQRAIAEPIGDLSVQSLVNWQDNGIGGRPDGSLQLTMPIPVWNHNQGAATQARFEAVAAERALEQLELDLENRLAPVYERYANASTQVERYRTKILPSARETLELARQAYTAGETAYVTLLTVQRTYSQTQLNYLESLREFRTAEAEIEGLLLTNSLQAR